MPWRCPACEIPIRHSEIEREPRPGIVYRCHVCRLELTLDPGLKKLQVAPIDLGESAARRVPETLPTSKDRRARLRRARKATRKPA